MQVDADIGSLDDLFHEQIRDARGKRPARGTGEAAVQVPAVGEVPIVGVEAVHVHHRSGNDGAGKGWRIDRIERLADDLDPADLVTVDGSAQPNNWPILFTMHDDEG